MSGILDALRVFRLMIRRCVVRQVDDEKNMQLLQLGTFKKAVRGNVEHFHPYGLSTKPLEGAEGIYAQIGGDADHGVALVISDRRYRLKPLQDGGVALYAYTGDYVVVRPDDREVEVHAGLKVILSAPDVEVQGRLKVTGTAHFDAQINCDAGVIANEITSQSAGPLNMSQVKNKYNTHVHPGGGAPNPQM